MPIFVRLSSPPMSSSMWTDRRLFVPRGVLVAALLLGPCALGMRTQRAFAEPAERSAPPAAATPGPFADVPLDNPAYAAGDTLGRWGFPFDRTGCYSPRTLTRYEFAVATQQVHRTLRETVTRVADGLAPVGGQSPSWRARKWAFIDARRLREALKLQETLVREFSRELQLVEARPNELLSDLRQWQTEVTALVKGGRKQRDPMIERHERERR